MIRGLATALVLAASVALPAPVLAQDTLPAASGPARTAAEQAFAAFDPLIGKTWRGVSITDPTVIDETRFVPILGGSAIRIEHSVNGGAYAGETLVVFDVDTGTLTTFYATNGGFYTTGTVAVQGPGAFSFEQTVHGLDGLTGVRAITTYEDEVYRTRASHLINGAWVERGGFDYRPTT